jgi:hypothetical protein
LNRIDAVSDLGDDPFKTDLACVREHLLAVDLEALAELDVGHGDDLLELGLALPERKFPDVAAVQIEQIESDQNDARGLALELVRQDREVGGPVRGWHDDLAQEGRETLGTLIPGPR